MLLDRIDALTAQITRLTARIEELIADIPAAQGVDADGTTGPGAADAGPDAAVLPAVARLDEIPGVSAAGAQVILAEIGLDMGRFRTAGHLASWAKLSPRTIQSGASNRSGRTGKGDPYLKGVLGEAAAAAAKTDTFPGERYRRIVERHSKLKALVAVAPSCSSSGICSPTPPPATTTSAPATTPAASTRTVSSATTSGRSKRPATPSPSPRPPDPHRTLRALATITGEGPLPRAQPDRVIFRLVQ
jgi:Transposase IS116/IS110/IS902 family